MIKTEECTGCSACEAICAQHAIVMKPNIGGFLYPELDSDKCVECGRCHTVCDLANSDDRNHWKAIYALKHNNPEIIKKSTSGGAFYMLAKSILEEGGAVYGAAFDEEFVVGHIRCDKLDALFKLQKSKYVQSNIQLVYKTLAEDLKLGKKVLFSGTACQCNGILSYLKLRHISIDNLITIDLICHGVPSPQIFKDYLKYRSEKGGKIVKVDFRDKVRSWRDFRMALTFQDGKKRTYRQNEDFFMVLFFHNFILRNSCYSCKYTSIDRVSDITLGDFWGLEEFYPKFNDDKGTSVVLISTEKGRNLFDRLKPECNCIEIKESEIKRRQPNLRRSSPKNPHYDEFWVDYESEGFASVIQKYADDTVLGQLKRKYLFKFLYYTGIFKLLLKFK